MRNKPWIKKNKYNAVKCESDGRAFDSKGERECYHMLKLLEHANEIVIKQCQHTVYLSDARIPYRVDFLIVDLEINRDVWVEYKGFETSDWRIKKRLWKSYGPGPLRIYKGYGMNMKMVEEVIPQPKIQFEF